MTAVSRTRCLWYYIGVVPDTFLSWKSSQRVKTWEARQLSESELTVYSSCLGQQNGDKRVINLHLWMPDSNPATCLASPSSRCPPAVHNSPLSQQSVKPLSSSQERSEMRCCTRFTPLARHDLLMGSWAPCHTPSPTLSAGIVCWSSEQFYFLLCWMT